MLKGLEMNGLRAAAAGKASAAAPVRPSALVSARAPASKHHQAFKSAQRPAVRASAAEPEAAPTTQRRQQKLPLDQLVEGNEYEGRVTKVEQFGAFVDIGFVKDGLVHVSQLSDKFVKSAAGVVAVGQTVRVKVMSKDATTGRIALSMKAAAKAAAKDEDEEAAVEEEEEEDVEAVAEDVPASEIVMIEAPEGFEYVSAAENPEFTFLMAEDDEEMTLESVAAFEALSADEIQREVRVEAVPVGEPIQGKVTRVEDYGAFIEFQYNNRTYTGLLTADEAKAPSAKLTAAQRAEATGGSATAPAYVEWDVQTMSQYYAVGDEVPAFVLEYNDRNQMSLSQYADWELQAAAMELEGDEEAEAALQGVDLDPLAEDPLALLEAESSLGAEDVSEFDEDSVEAELRDDYATQPDLGLIVSAEANMAFPSRPLNRINTLAINSLTFKDTDFDGDEITLEDFWQESFQVPKHALKRLGLKIQYNEAGEPEVVEKEGATAGSFDLSRAIRPSHNARVRAFVKDLMAAEEDEAEVAPLAARRPVVLMATAVQNISAATVKDLRTKTGAGMMDCKKALAENDGDVEKAIEWLRKKGLAGADKKAGRLAAEGAIVSYIHPGSRLGVLLEVNCETDFVAASDKFNQLAQSIAMQIAASPTVAYVTAEDIPAEVYAREKEIEMGREDLKNKPEAIRAKIAEGRVAKLAQDMALLPQPYLMDPSKTVEQAVKEAVAAIGEKISVRRFVKYQLGEGIEKKVSNLAEEVAAATGAKKA